MTPDANDASPSPEPQFDPGGDLEAGTMAESSVDLVPSDEKSPSQSKDSAEPNAKRNNSKDPSRPRRKKARRACFACQRAHLTCGDERPCLRCIKRGLQDHCTDGVRKKAKYLHDAPNEALIPGIGGSYHTMNGVHQTVSAASQAHDGSSVAGSSAFYSPSVPTPGFPAFGQSAGQVPSPSVQDPSIMGPFGSQPTPMASTRYSVDSGQQVSPMQQSMTSMDQSTPADTQQNQQFSTPFLDPTDPSFFNFDISGLNFGNHYGALEFGMLGHMSSGAVETPDIESGMMNPLGQPHASNPYDASSTNTSAFTGASAGFPYTSSTSNLPRNPWNNNSSVRQGSASQLYGSQVTGSDGTNNFDQSTNFPNAFTIGEGNGSISGASPSTNGLDFTATYATSPNASSSFYPSASQQQQPDYNRTQPQQARHASRGAFPDSNDLALQSGNRKRRRDPSHIYSSVNKPYSYTTGFHALTAFLQKRFSPQKTLRIAKAIASIRPSFISCTNKLNHDDLIFMEKCFQRTLWEYEDFINAYGTPTVICRRTGEVAAVSKEFSLLTGWRRDILLGKEANLNVNAGGTSGHQTGTSSRGAVTPRNPNAGVENTPGRPQPVFLAELLDDDSVIQFYDDFAKLAFGDPRGYAINPCKLLKYKTKEDSGWGPDEDTAARLSAADAKGQRGLISGEAGMNALGEKDGKVDCMYCWSVKRDVFDIPMLIVMNFLPCI